MAGRTRFNAMEPMPHPTWRVVLDQFHRPISVRELPPNTDLRGVMIDALFESKQKGFLPDELPGAIPIYFCTRGSERRMVTIAHRDPKDPNWVSRSY